MEPKPGSRLRPIAMRWEELSGKSVVKFLKSGVSLSRPELIELGQAELEAVIPGIDLSEVEWGSYRVDRAERQMPGGKRPETYQILSRGKYDDDLADQAGARSRLGRTSCRIDYPSVPHR